MKIALIHNQIKPNGGGMDRYLYELISGFSTAGHTVSVLAHKIKDKPTHTEVIQYKQHWLPRRFKKFGFIQHINRHFDKGQFDLSISLTRSSNQDIAACGGTHPGYLARMQRKANWLDKREIACEQASFRATPCIMAHSPLIADEIAEHYPFAKDKINMLYPPILELSTDGHDKITTQLNLSNNKINLLFPSVGHKVKNLEALLGAFRALPPRQFHLWIAGAPASSLQLPDNVSHVGYCDNMGPLYAAMDFTILPSHYEAFGMVLIESISCGTPVISTPRAGCLPLISAQDGLVIQDLSADGIRQAILQGAEKTFTPNRQIIKDKQLRVSDHVEAIMSRCMKVC